MLKNFRDLFTILVGVVVFPGLWLVQGLGWTNIPEGVIGATIAIETLIAQFYFRKAPTSEGIETPETSPPAK